MLFDNQAVFEEKIGVEAVRLDARKDCGLRFFLMGCDIKVHPERWDEFIEWQMNAVIALKAAVDEVVA